MNLPLGIQCIVASRIYTYHLGDLPATGVLRVHQKNFFVTSRNKAHPSESFPTGRRRCKSYVFFVSKEQSDKDGTLLDSKRTRVSKNLPSLFLRHITDVLQGEPGE